MKTLDDLVEGTYVGYYSMNIYLAILGVVGVILLSIGLMNMQHERDVVQKEIAQYYDINQEGAERVTCYQGMLHYPNVNIFAGVIPYQPAIACNAEELAAMHDVTYQNLFWLGLFIVFVSLFMGLFSFFVGKKRFNRWGEL